MNRIEKGLFFLVILFLPTQLGLHFWPKFSYIYSLKIDYLSPTIYFWDILVAGLIMVWLFSKQRINLAALNLLLFFLLTQLFSLLGAENIGAGMVRLEQYVIAGLFGSYIASQEFEELPKRIFLPLLLGVTLESVIALLQFIKGATIGVWILGERTFSISTPAIAKFDFYGYEFLRPYGTFSHPNVLAAFLLMSICILYQIKNNTINKLVLLMGIFAIFLTMSRTAILLILCAAVLLFRRKWRLFKKISWHSSVITLMTLFLLPIIFTRFFSLFNFDYLTFLRREELIENSIQLFLKSPISGIGLNNFIPAMAGNLITGPSRFLQPVHNIFLLSLSETGITGLIGFLSLVGFPILKILNLKSKIINLLPWLIILFLGMFDHYFLTLPQGFRLLFLVWGLSNLSARMKK